MKLLMITFDPPQNVGGIEGRCNNYTKHLMKLGHFVEVISFSPEGDFSREELNGAPLLRYPSSSRHAFKALRRTSNEISKNSIDSIFLLSGALTLYGVLVLAYARWKGITTLALYYGKDILSAKRSLSASLALKISPRLVRKIAVNSQFTANLLPTKYSKKIEVLYPSVDPAIISSLEVTSPHKANSESEDQAYADDSWENQERTILFVGRLVKRKGVDDLLNAFKKVLIRLPNSKLEIVGDGPELPTLKTRAVDLGIATNVQFFGKLSGDPLYQRYILCTAFVMPSKATSLDVEGFGTVFLEAGIFGKPSIGTVSGGIPEAIEDGVTGILVPESNVDLLAEALEKVLVDSGLARILGENARRRVLAEFTWDNSTRQLASMLIAKTSKDFSGV